jgi:hypothetical protein
MRYAVRAILFAVAIARPASGQMITQLLGEIYRFETECPTARDSLRLSRDSLQPTALVGEVTNQDTGQPLESAGVLLTPGDHRAGTDSLGAFRIDRIPEGRYQVLIRRIGFAQYKDSLSIDARVGTRLHVPLVPAYGHRCELVRRGPFFPPIPLIPPPNQKPEGARKI